ncbi:MAG: hypothetical protein QOG54_2283 [Actinomycetota bacterium]|jgi:Ca2+-binding RTX toxin-like protein|nr:hypothetical protein [Actinomycetota bacterium]
MLDVTGVDDVSVGRLGDALAVEGQACPQATVNNVDLIVFHDVSPDGGLNVFLDFTNGPLGPGATAETDGTSEIEVKLDIAPGGDDYDKIVLVGGEEADTFTVGNQAIAFNDDADADVDVGDNYSDLRIVLESHGGADELSAAGGRGTGGPEEIGISFFGGDGDDTLVGGIGGDRLEGEGGADAIDGGNGGSPPPYTPWDVIGFSISTAGVTVDLQAGTASGGDADGDTYLGIDSVYGTESDDSMKGDDRINALLGGGGADQIDGRGDDDYLEGGLGPDDMNGGDGFDSINYYSSLKPLEIDLGAHTASGGDANGDTFSQVEEVAGSPQDDHIVGDDEINELGGYYGNDLIEGAGGNDFLAGNAGKDEAFGGPGNDAFGMSSDTDGADEADVADGGPGDDFADYWGRTAPVSMSSDDGPNDGERGEGDELISIEGFGASDSADLIKGGRNDDEMRGHGGDDELTGGGGEDELRGDNDDDDVNGGGGNDKVKGGDGEDKLNGSGGNDVIDGGPGVDVIDGGPGRDVCYVTQGDETKNCEKRAHKRAH